jgi:arginyl-tRNA synthetase
VELSAMKDLRKDIQKFVKKIFNQELSIEVPPDQKLGNYAVPCFSLAKELKKSPQLIAKDAKEEFEKEIKKDKKLAKILTVQSTGPYLNFFVEKTFIADEVIGEILKKKEKYGSSTKSKEKIMVEYFHANTHKGVHIGHIRNISMAEPLCRILEAVGNKVLRVNYQGDIGPHVAKCIWGYKNTKELPPITRKGIWLGKLYGVAHKASEDEKVEKEIKDINLKLYAGDKELIKVWKETRQWCLDDFEQFYKEFNVKFDEFYFESETEKEGKKIANELLKKSIAVKDGGAVIVDLKKHDLGVAIILTREGYALYQTKELGLAKKKLDKHKVDKSIHVVGQEQELFFQQIFKIYELMGSSLAHKSYHLSYGLVMLPEGKMSSREGTMVLYSDLIEELISLARSEVVKRHQGWQAYKIDEVSRKIAFGAMKFAMVNRDTNKEIIFEKQRVLDFEGETAAYVQYVFARINSLFRKAEEEKIKVDLKHADLSLLKEIQEIELINLLKSYPNVLEHAAEDYRPNLVARYVLDLAQKFNEFYHSCLILKEKEKLRNARLTLAKAVQQTTNNALYLLNIDTCDEM